MNVAVEWSLLNKLKTLTRNKSDNKRLALDDGVRRKLL